MGCAFAQCPAYQGESKTLGFDGIHEAAPKSVTQPCRERLGMGINPQARAIERSSILGQEIVFRRQLEQNRSTGGDRKAGITTLKRVANTVRFILVEDDGLVGFRQGHRATHVVRVDPAVRKYEVRGGNVFLVAPVLAGAWTCDVPDGRSFGHQKRAGIEIGHGVKPLRFDRR